MRRSMMRRIWHDGKRSRSKQGKRSGGDWPNKEGKSAAVIEAVLVVVVVGLIRTVMLVVVLVIMA